MKCPQCGLENPTETMRCDCGFDFRRHDGSPPASVTDATPNEPSTNLAAFRKENSVPHTGSRTVPAPANPRRGFWWPDVQDAESALAASKQGKWAALIVAGITMLMALLGGAGVQVIPKYTMNLWALLDGAIFLLVAWGIHRMSGTAAILGLIVFLAERIEMASRVGVQSLPVAIIITLAFINGVRGTFALRSFVAKEGAESVRREALWPNRLVIAVIGTVLVISLGGYLWPRLQTRGDAGASIDDQLQAIPVFRQVKLHEPATYEVLKTRVIEASRNGISEEAIAAASRDAVVLALGKYLPRASDDAVVEFTHLLVRQIAALESKDPAEAFVFLFPQDGQRADHSSVPKALLEMGVIAGADVIRTGAESPKRLANDERAQALLEAVVSRMPPELSSELESLGAPNHPGVNKAGVVRTARALYEEVLRLPRADAGLVLRYMFSTGSETEQTQKAPSSP